MHSKHQYVESWGLELRIQWALCRWSPPTSTADHGMFFKGMRMLTMLLGQWLWL